MRVLHAHYDKQSKQEKFPHILRMQNFLTYTTIDYRLIIVCILLSVVLYQHIDAPYSSIYLS